MRIPLACHANSFGRYGPDGAMQHLAAMGVSLLELPIKTHGIPSLFEETPLLTEVASPDDVARAAARIHEAGLSICSCNVTTGNPLDEGDLEKTLQKLKIAHRLGVSLVVGGGGAFHNPEEESRLVRNIRRIGDVAADLGIVYCCETHPGACVNAAGMLRLLEQVDRPGIRINFDTANLFFYNQEVDVYGELQKVLPVVGHLHFKDSRGKYQEWYFPALGDGGAVDFRQLRSVLEASGFSGPCSLELEGIAGEGPLSLEQYVERVQRSLVHLQVCGFTWLRDSSSHDYSPV